VKPPQLQLSVYIHEGRLVAAGVFIDEDTGALPIAFCFECPENEAIKDGPVNLDDFGADSPEPWNTIWHNIQRGVTKQTRLQAQRMGASALVTRARQGDQNSLAMIRQIKIDSKKSPAANRSRKLIMEFIKEQPANFHGETCPIKTAYSKYYQDFPDLVEKAWGKYVPKKFSELVKNAKRSQQISAEFDWELGI
jgi:hypothetical protein